MNCIEVQQLLSEAVDREPVSREQLDEARAHCSTCATCSQFVQGLARVHTAPLPAEPEGLADRVVLAVREEAARASEAAAAATADESRDAVVVPIESQNDAGRRRGARKRMSPVAVGAWIGAAAAVLIVASFAAVSGVRSIVQGPSDASLSERQAEEGFMTTPSTTDQAAQAPSAEGDAAKAATGTAGTAGASVAASSPNMIAVNGFAYRLLGATPVDRSRLTTYSSTTTSLDSQAAPQTYTVYKTPTGGRVALVRGDEMLIFDIARRNYGGRLYALTSGALSSFEVWPTLPPSIPQPTTPQGAPTFVTAGRDDLAVEVYRLPTVPATTGIAVPPGTPQSDPSGGNPEWTWWVPPPQ